MKFNTITCFSLVSFSHISHMVSERPMLWVFHLSFCSKILTENSHNQPMPPLSFNMVGKNDKHQDITLNPSSVYYLHPTDIRLKLVNSVFKGVGFKEWKRAMTIALSTKNKLGFVETVKRPTMSVSNGKAWDRVNDIVIGWIMNVVDDNILRKVSCG